MPRASFAKSPRFLTGIALTLSLAAAVAWIIHDASWQRTAPATAPGYRPVNLASLTNTSSPLVKTLDGRRVWFDQGEPYRSNSITNGQVFVHLDFGTSAHPSWVDNEHISPYGTFHVLASGDGRADFRLVVDGLASEKVLPKPPSHVPGALILSAGVFLFLATVGWIRLELQSRRAYQFPPGACKRCGYDLRGSLDQCPECGTPISSTNNPQPTTDKLTSASSAAQTPNTVS